MSITMETRNSSYKEVKKSLNDRQTLILQQLSNMDEPVSAKELVMHLHSIGKSDTTDRNYVHPRLNELVALGLVEVVGKKKCQYTNRKVALYKYKSL